MKRQVEREVRLSAFALERGDLELLWERMLALFDSNGEQPIRASISLSIPSERLTFDSIEELNSYTALRGRIVRFSLRIQQGNRSVFLSTGGVFFTTPTLKVDGDSDIWCAGAIEAVVHVVRNCRVWYFWLVNFPFTIVFMVLAFSPWLKQGPFRAFPEMPVPALLSWFVITTLFGYFAIFKERLLPTASITLTRELGFIRRYSGELGLILGVLALILATYMWIVPYGA